MTVTAKQSLFRRLHSASSTTPKWNNERFSRCRGSSGRGARGRGERQRTARCTLQGYFQYAYLLPNISCLVHLIDINKTYKKKNVHLSIVLLVLRFCSCIVRKKNMDEYILFHSVSVRSTRVACCRARRVLRRRSGACEPPSPAPSSEWAPNVGPTRPLPPFLTNNVLSDSRDDVEVHRTRIGPLTEYYNLRRWVCWSF